MPSGQETELSGKGPVRMRRITRSLAGFRVLGAGILLLFACQRVIGGTQGVERRFDDSKSVAPSVASDSASRDLDPLRACGSPRLVFKEAELGGDGGARSPASILDVVRRHVGEIPEVLMGSLVGRPDSGGTISIKFAIGPAGNLRSFSVKTAGLGDAAFEERFEAAFEGMNFERIEFGSVTATFTYAVKCE